MAYPAIIAAATPINLSPSSVKSRATSPLLCACSRDSSLTVRNPTNRRSNRLPWIKPAAASDSTAIADNPSPESTSDGEEIQAKIGARVRGKSKNTSPFGNGNISANLPYKIEFFEKLEGRGDAPVMFFAHLKEDDKCEYDEYNIVTKKGRLHRAQDQPELATEVKVEGPNTVF
ncbi:hypothetical protein L1987_31514 [Smallanthus sonchifolius]|uniref:Uncharacterized protein n=1 Tax=Smallanthus sonchifolius TaxID=185202 RepID=A0ACB9I553_9ASTR|nr:hypothetical protein L1987_31514 [Smallanthus sonchifolius]